MPLHPPIAHTWSGQARTYSRNSSKPVGSVANRPPPSTLSSAAITSIGTDRLCGSIPITTRCDSIAASLARTNGLSRWEGTATSS